MPVSASANSPSLPQTPRGVRDNHDAIGLGGGSVRGEQRRYSGCAENAARAYALSATDDSSVLMSAIGREPTSRGVRGRLFGTLQAHRRSRIYDASGKLAPAWLLSVRLLLSGAI